MVEKFGGLVWFAVNLFALVSYGYLVYGAWNMYVGTLYGVFVFCACGFVGILILVSVVENIRVKWWQKTDHD